MKSAAVRGSARHAWTSIRHRCSWVKPVELRDLFQLLLHPDVVAAAQCHQKQTETDERPESPNCLDQLFNDLVDSMRNPLEHAVSPRFKQTPDLNKVGGLREFHLVGHEV